MVAIVSQTTSTSLTPVNKANIALALMGKSPFRSAKDLEETVNYNFREFTVGELQRGVNFALKTDYPVSRVFGHSNEVGHVLLSDPEAFSQVKAWSQYTRTKMSPYGYFFLDGLVTNPIIGNDIESSLTLYGGQEIHEIVFTDPEPGPFIFDSVKEKSVEKSSPPVRLSTLVVTPAQPSVIRTQAEKLRLTGQVMDKVKFGESLDVHENSILTDRDLAFRDDAQRNRLVAFLRENPSNAHAQPIGFCPAIIRTQTGSLDTELIAWASEHRHTNSFAKSIHQSLEPVGPPPKPPELKSQPVINAITKRRFIESAKSSLSQGSRLEYSKPHIDLFCASLTPAERSEIIEAAKIADPKSAAAFQLGKPDSIKETSKDVFDIDLYLWALGNLDHNFSRALFNAASVIQDPTCTIPMTKQAVEDFEFLTREREFDPDQSATCLAILTSIESRISESKFLPKIKARASSNLAGAPSSVPVTAT